MIIDTLVEGPTDEAVARKLIATCGHEFGTGYGKQGHNYLRQKASGFNTLAKYGNPILMLVDFIDTEFECPPEVLPEWLPSRNDKMLLRVVVRELESWLLADVKGLANFFGISEARIPRNPENLPDPKQVLVNLARRSRRRVIRDALVPHPNISAVVGPGYAAAIEEFVSRHWAIEAASERASSLERCVARLGELR